MMLLVREAIVAYLPSIMYTSLFLKALYQRTLTQVNVMLSPHGRNDFPMYYALILFLVIDNTIYCHLLYYYYCYVIMHCHMLVM